MKRRVVITGIGPVTPIGIGKEDFWQSLLSGKSGVGMITAFDTTNFNVKIAAEVKDFNFENYGDKKEGRRMDRMAQFAVAASKIAVQDAGLDMSKENPYRCGVCVGSGIGGLHTFTEQTWKFKEKGPRFVSPLFIPMILGNMASGEIAIACGMKGINTCLQTACATSTNALGDAFRSIAYGDADVILAGGSEAAVNEMAIAGFGNMKALSTDNDRPQQASRPFDKTRNGFVLGEGAGVLVLEELEHAKQRGAYIYAELAGYGANCDAHHMTAPDPTGEGAAECFRMALMDAGLQPEDVDYINAHGTSTELNDKAETLAIKNVFGEYAYKLAVSSIKSMTGHLLGAAGGIEAIATVLAITKGILPPTINYENVDAENGLDLDYVPNKARAADVKVALSNNLGFGGHNACIVLKKFE
ncbi:MAG: beta-ketoacyl-ACP synthase II [Phascolarctobacterium sp.]|nr:beta-ketoacyl-ACP synthase II [Candidatus Phascolarctobacterium caballi]